MAKIQRAGNIQLKVIDIEAWNDKSGTNIGLRFYFVDAQGDTTQGVQSYTRKDGSVNENIETFIAANESGKSLLCEVEEREYNGKVSYEVKWPVKGEGVKVNAAKAREMVKAAQASKTTASETPTGDIPF